MQINLFLFRTKNIQPKMPLATLSSTVSYSVWRKKLHPLSEKQIGYLL